MSISLLTLLFMLRLLIAEFLYARTLPKRKSFWLRYVAVVLVLSVIAWFYPASWFIGFPQNPLSFLLLFALTICGMLICFDCSVWNVLFACIAGYLSEHFATQVDYILQDLTESLPASSNLQMIVCTVIASALTFAAFWLLFARRVHKGEHPNVDNKRLILLVGTALLICIGVSSVALEAQKTLSADVNRTLVGTQRIYAMITTLVMLMLLFGFLEHKQLETDVTVLAHLLHQERAQYEMSKENIERINIKCHDLKHQIAALRTNASEEAIREIENAVLIYDSTVKTGNDALDVILTEKSLYCQASGIRMTCMVESEKLGFFDTADLYALFGNLIDNAIEAVSRIEDEAMRDLTLLVRQERNFIVIETENYYMGTLTFVDGVPATTKTVETGYHGFGMKSIRLLSEKYGGTMVLDTADGIFRVKVVLPIPQKC